MALASNLIYLESYVESTTGLPPELQRILTTIKSLDERTVELQESLRKNVEAVCSMGPQAAKKAGSDQIEKLNELQQQVDIEQKALLQFADEKVQLAQQAHDLLDLHASELDGVLEAFETELAQNRALNPPDQDQYLPTFEPGGKRPRDWDALQPAESMPRPRGGMGMGMKGRRDTEGGPSQKRKASVTFGAAPAPLLAEEFDFPEVEHPAPILGLMSPIPPGLQQSSATPQAPGKLLQHSDIAPALKGRWAELFWPDDNNWYLIEVQHVDTVNKKANIMYSTGETEELDLIEIIQSGHMSLVDV